MKRTIIILLAFAILGTIVLVKIHRDYQRIVVLERINELSTIIMNRNDVYDMDGSDEMSELLELEDYIDKSRANRLTTSSYPYNVGMDCSIFLTTEWLFLRYIFALKLSILRLLLKLA